MTSVPASRTILLLVPNLSGGGGTEKMISELGSLLAEHHVVIECSVNRFESRTFPTANRATSLDVPTTSFRLIRFVYYLVAARRLRRLKNELRVDATISNLWAADLVNALSNGPGARVSIAHINIVGNKDNRLMLRYRRLVGCVYRRFHRVVAVNDHLKHELMSLFGLDPKKATTIRNFIPDRHVAGDERIAGNGRTRLLWCGRLSPVKNLAPVLATFRNVLAKAPHAQLLVVGTGPQESELWATATQLGLRVSRDVQDPSADVIFAGFDRDPIRLMRAGALFLLSSLSEGFGLVIVEAMSAGLPVLASDCPTGGPLSIMKGGVTYVPGRTQEEETPFGYLLPVPLVGDIEASRRWEDAILALLQDQAKHARKAAACRERARYFLASVVKAEWLQLVESN